MKLRKIMAGIAAAAVASSSLAVAASAGIYVPEDTSAFDPGCIPGEGQWLVQAYNVGNPDENKPAVDYGVDYSTITGVRFTIEIDQDNPDFADPDTGENSWLEFFAGAFGGAVVFSCNGGDIIQYENPDDPFRTESEVWAKYNWVGEPSKAFWGCTYIDALGEEISTDPNVNTEDTADDNPISAKSIGDYKYVLEYNGYDNPLSCTTDAWDIKEIGCMQICLQIWGDEIVPIEVLGCELLDASGNVVLSFDAYGNATLNAPSAPETDAPATDAPETDAPATDAPATDAPVAGDSTGKPNTNTGVEGLALVAGIAVVATGAIVVAKKRS